MLDKLNIVKQSFWGWC